MAVTEKTAVSLAQDVYREPGRPPLPSGWSIFYNCTETDQKDGYFGAAYQFNIDSHNAAIVIAHRGTANRQGKWEDFKMWAFNTIPAQFYEGAIPFISDVFFQLNNSTYNQTRTYLYFTGHSLGATLSELSIIHYIHYFDSDSPHYNPYRVWGNDTYVFESPGSANLVSEQLANKEITRRDIKDGGKTIQVYNSEVNAINTCMPTSALRNRKRIFAAIGNQYSCLSNSSELDYSPTLEFYAHGYTLSQHSMRYLYNWVNTLAPSAYSVIQVSEWPVGNKYAYHNYLSYYAVKNRNFENHNRYWEQYTTVLWNQDPSLRQRFNNDLSAFQDFYYKTELRYVAGYLGNIDASTLTDTQGLTTRLYTPVNSAGCAASGIGDVNGDGIGDYMLSIPWGDDHWKGTVYIFYGGKNSVGLIIKGLVNSWTGASISGTGDLNGDNIPDLLIGAPGINCNAPYCDGAVYLVYGGQNGIIDLANLLSSQGLIIKGTKGSWTGYSVSGTGDTNGDCIPDFLIGAPNYLISPPNFPPGAAFLIYGGQGGVIDLANLLSTQGLAIYGFTNSSTGISVSGTGDMNADNIPDFLVGVACITQNSPYYGGCSQVAAFLIYGGQSGPINLASFQSSQGFIIKGPVNSNGISVSGTGDVDGDGIFDLLVGIARAFNCSGGFLNAPVYDFSIGAAYLVYGGQNGTIDVTTLSYDQGFEIRGTTCNGPSSTNFAQEVSGLGDVNKDGFADFAIGARIYNDHYYSKIAYIILGGDGGAVNLLTFPNIRGFVITEIANEAHGVGSGSCLALSGMGDTNGDYISEILTSFPAFEPYYSNPNMVGHIIYGRPQPTISSSSNKRNTAVNQAEKDPLSAPKTHENNAPAQKNLPKPASKGFLNLYNLAGRQFNVFYQQAKEYLASFWNASWYRNPENKARILSIQEQKRLDKLNTVKATLDKLEDILKRTEPDNKIYLTKILTFYQKMVAEWQKNVIHISPQDIRDLQADIATIKEAVYLAPIFPELSIDKVVRKSAADTSFGFFSPTNVPFAAVSPALAAQHLPAVMP